MIGLLTSRTKVRGASRIDAENRYAAGDLAASPSIYAAVSNPTPAWSGTNSALADAEWARTCASTGPLLRFGDGLASEWRSVAPPHSLSLN